MKQNKCRIRSGSLKVNGQKHWACNPLYENKNCLQNRLVLFCTWCIRYLLYATLVYQLPAYASVQDVGYWQLYLGHIWLDFKFFMAAKHPFNFTTSNGNFRSIFPHRQNTRSLNEPCTFLEKLLPNDLLFHRQFATEKILRNSFEQTVFYKSSTAKFECSM